MGISGIQALFFQRVKAQLPAHLSLVDEITTLLGISPDSAYRRIRGEKSMTFDEIKILASHFSVSIDHLFGTDNSNFIFTDTVIKKEKYDFDDQLDFHLRGLQSLKAAGNMKIIYFSRDIAIYYFYQFPELLAFKYFYWMQTVYENPEFLKKKFTIDENILLFADKAKTAARFYAEFPCTEIWALEHINLTLQQIAFYKETYMFKNPAEIDIIYDKVDAMIDHIETQAELGKKFIYNEPVQANAGSFELYVNEFMIGGNNILAKSDNKMVAFINHSIMNYLVTDDPVFCAYVLKRIESVVKKSDLISRVGEKQRKNFFKKIREKIEQSRNQ